MPKNEEGEFELILGNRQLLAVFFIVVVLLGVFFTMGYIVARNSAPAAIADTPVHKESKPLVVDPAAPAEQPAPAPAAESAAPASESAVPEKTPTEPEAAPEKPKTAAAAKKDASKPAASPSTAPAAGQSYLQLAATSQREADIEVDVLRKKGFKAMAVAKPDQPGTYRVLVGPIPEGGVNKLKSDLQAAGFPGDRAIRRTF